MRASLSGLRVMSTRVINPFPISSAVIDP